MKKQRYSRAPCVRLLVCCLLAAMLLSLSVFPAGAETSGSLLSTFEARSVSDDLAGSVMDGKAFDISAYPYIATSTYMQILSFLEFGYNEFDKTDSRYNDYSLYLYVYNAGNLPVAASDRRHSVTLRIGDSGTYTKYRMKLLSSAGDPTHRQLYMKFKVDVSADELRKALGSATERVYQLSEMEIVTTGQTNATAYEGGKWTFSGFSEGYGKTGSPALTARNDKLDGTVVITDLGQGVYRKAADNTGWNYIQIDSVYFTIPHEITDKYGEKLVDILYEYYAYNTGWMVGFEHDKAYNLFKDQEGVELEGSNSSLPQLYTKSGSSVGTVKMCDWSYNLRGFALPTITCSLLSHIFKYDEGAEAGTVIDTDVKQYFSAEWAKHENGQASIFDRLSAPEGIEVYNLIHSKDLDYKLNTFDGNWWQKAWNCNSAYEVLEVPPIQMVDDTNVNDVEGQLYLNKTFANDVKPMYDSAKTRGDKMYVFHFAAGDYNAGEIKASSYLWDGSETWLVGSEEAGFVCRENIYMDFDMLEMTFERNGIQMTLPVQASPVNVIGELQLPDDYNPTDDGLPKWAIIGLIILVVILVLVLLPILAPILKPLLQALVWLIALPFKLLWWFLKAVGKGVSALFRKIGEAIDNHKK